MSSNYSAPSGAGIPDPQQQAQRPKRSRILLSCAPCRFSKLKCDRESPCGQCLKKGRTDLCQYAPKPEKKKPAKSMASRLKHLEGMVRGMMDADGNIIPQDPLHPSSRGGRQGEGDDDSAGDDSRVTGQVIRDQHESTAYVGATHCMAMLEDIEDLKCYFDESGEGEDDESRDEELEEPDVLFNLSGSIKSREELLGHLPEKNVADRLITRYFASMSPSQHIVHRGHFARQYARFWQHPDEATLHWLAQLFMMLALGVHFNKYQAPNEVEADSPMPTTDRIKHYRSCAGWALAAGKYTQPHPTTLPAFMLYVEANFLLNRASQMNCYILSGVCIRLMLKMGLHRDPNKLGTHTPFEGEMRRRMWNMAIQIESIVSFHMGLPSMIPSIETDTEVPRNLEDDDFDENTKELPAGRPYSVWTAMTYPIHKTNIVRVFGKIARHAHSLEPPQYREVLRLDGMLQETWKIVPSFMMVRPLEECVGDSSSLHIQRFGLAALYNKSRCVLHRRYLVEPTPKSEHDYSRQQCLEGAMTLLRNQAIVWEACRPGNTMAHNGWFVSSLAVHDYLLAAVVLYLVIKNEHYANPNSEHNWMLQQSPSPSKEQLTDMIRHSHWIWTQVARTSKELRKTADTIAVMLSRLGTPVGSEASMSEPSPIFDVNKYSVATSSVTSDFATQTFGGSSNSADPFSTQSFQGALPNPSQPFSMAPPTDPALSMGFPGMESADSLSYSLGLDSSSSWVPPNNDMDWRYLDISLAHSHTGGTSDANGPDPVWTASAGGNDGWGLGNMDFWSGTG